MTNVFDLKTDAELLKSLEKATSQKMTAEEINQQRVSFIFSAMSEKSHVTHDRIREILSEKEGVGR